MRQLLLVLFVVFHHAFSFAQITDLPNVVVITIDGFRWQELFNGADSSIISSTKFVKDTASIKQLFWDTDKATRRKALLPFVWNTLVKQGTIYGNKALKSSVLLNNPYLISYAGYNELFTGYADPAIFANKKVQNVNENVLEFLNNQEPYKNKVAAFTSWNLFKYIFNSKKSSFYLNTGFQNMNDSNLNSIEKFAYGVHQYILDTTVATRNDMLTFIAAKEYIQRKHPKVVYVGFGETDEYAHTGNYDNYLQSVHSVDDYIAQLWYLFNSNAYYKNNTYFIITTDHGRGNKASTWRKHNMLTAGSKNAWLILLGPKINNIGEAKHSETVFTSQLAKTIAYLCGFEFDNPSQIESTLSSTIIK
jgi:hypothetical protein